MQQAGGLWHGGAQPPVEFTLAGEVASKDQVGALRLGFLVALLQRSMEGSVNFVNSPMLAGERNMHILEDSEGSAGNYTNLIKARVSSQDGHETHVVSGTVFGNGPRFVRVDDLFVDLAPKGHLLLTRHTDQPGVAVGRPQNSRPLRKAAAPTS